jgi:hypothetical protein
VTESWLTLSLKEFFIKEEGMSCHAEVPGESSRLCQKVEAGVRTNHSPAPLLCFPWESIVRAGRGKSLGLASLNDIRSL